jgi:hypothetical protein
MTNQLVSNWIIVHFVKFVNTWMDGISPFDWHLQIFDKHGMCTCHFGDYPTSQKGGFGFAHLTNPHFA